MVFVLQYILVGVTAMSNVTGDPFAALDIDPEPARTTQLYISGRLTLLRIPAGVCSEWTVFNLLKS